MNIQYIYHVYIPVFLVSIQNSITYSANCEKKNLKLKLAKSVNRCMLSVVQCWHDISMLELNSLINALQWFWTVWPIFILQFGKHTWGWLGVIWAHVFVLKVNSYFGKVMIIIVSSNHSLYVNTETGAEDINSSRYPLLPNGDLKLCCFFPRSLCVQVIDM